MKSKSLVACFNYKKAKLEVHVLANIFDIGRVSPSHRPRFLINSGNEYMVGTALPYFPRGGLPPLVFSKTFLFCKSHLSHVAVRTQQLVLYTVCLQSVARAGGRSGDAAP